MIFNSASFCPPPPPGGIGALQFVCARVWARERETEIGREEVASANHCFIKR